MKKLQDNELKIFYKGKIDKEMEQAFVKLLVRFGYYGTTSGTDADAKVRGLLFVKKE